MLYEIVYALTQYAERLIGRYLTSYVEMQSCEFNIGLCIAIRYCFFKHLHRYAELVFFQTRGYVVMSVSIDVGIYSQRHVGITSQSRCNHLNHFKLRNRFNIEASDARFKRILDFTVTLPYSGKYDVGGVESHVQSSFNLTAAYAVNTKTCLLDYTQYFGVGIGLYRIVYVIIGVMRSLLDCLEC